MRLQRFFSAIVFLPFVALVTASLEIHASPSVADSAAVEDFDKTVLPIKELKFKFADAQANYGIGFCLDPECRFIVTNYHVRQMAQPKKIAGHRIFAQYQATRSNDDGATLVRVAAAPPMRFAYSHDLALFELDRRLAARHGASFSLNELQLEQDVDIYAYPLKGTLRFRKLIHFHGRFFDVTDLGLLAFDYELSAARSANIKSSPATSQ